MFRKFSLSITLTLVVILVLAAPALAGGVVVSLDTTPSDVQTGEAFTVGFMVFSAHDGSPDSELEPLVTATHPTSGQEVRVTAEREGAAGHYVAQLTLPAEGTWNWEIQPFGASGDWFPPSVMTPLEVSAGVASVADAAPGSPIASTFAPWMSIIGIIAMAVAGLLVVLRLRTREVARP